MTKRARLVQYSREDIARLFTRFLRDALISDLRVEAMLDAGKDLSHIAEGVVRVGDELRRIAKEHSPEEAHVLLLSVVLSLEGSEDKYEPFDLDSAFEFLVAETEVIARAMGMDVEGLERFVLERIRGGGDGEDHNYL